MVHFKFSDSPLPATQKKAQHDCKRAGGSAYLSAFEKEEKWEYWPASAFSATGGDGENLAVWSESPRKMILCKEDHTSKVDVWRIV